MSLLFAGTSVINTTHLATKQRVTTIR